MTVAIVCSSFCYSCYHNFASIWYIFTIKIKEYVTNFNICHQCSMCRFCQTFYIVDIFPRFEDEETVFSCYLLWNAKHNHILQRELPFLFFSFEWRMTCKLTKTGGVLYALVILQGVYVMPYFLSNVHQSYLFNLWGTWLSYT